MPFLWAIHGEEIDEKADGKSEKKSSGGVFVISDKKNDEWAKSSALSVDNSKLSVIAKSYQLQTWSAFNFEYLISWQIFSISDKNQDNKELSVERTCNSKKKRIISNYQQINSQMFL